MPNVVGAALFVFCAVLSLPSAGATEHSIRVGLTDSARVLSIHSSSPFSLRLSSGQRVRIVQQVTVKYDRDRLLVNRRAIEGSALSIVGEGKTYQVRMLVSKNQRSEKQSPKEWTVRGTLEIRKVPSGLAAINHIDLEAYVAGVVSSEVSPKWPLEALKAQAVAARTYVLYKQMNNHQQLFDVVASVQDQVYHGHAARSKSVRRAVAETQGQVVTYKQRPIYAAYSSTAAGPTEDALYVWALDLPYLKGVDCPFDDQAPRYTWRTSFTFDYLERQLRKEGFTVGTVATLTPYTFTPSGRVDRVRLLHSGGEIILRGQDLRRIVGYSKIFSTRFSVQSIGAEVVIQGHGAGHAVGMCQWGMREMAALGYGYQSILQHYYPGTALLALAHVTLSPMPNP